MDTEDNFSDRDTLSLTPSKASSCVGVNDMRVTAPRKAKMRVNNKYHKKHEHYLRKIIAKIAKRNQISRTKLVKGMLKALKRKARVTSKKTVIPLITRKHSVRSSEAKKKTKHRPVQGVPKKVLPEEKVPSKSVPPQIDWFEGDDMCEAPKAPRTKLIYKPYPASQVASMPKPRFECEASKEFPRAQKSQKNIKKRNPAGQEESMPKKVVPIGPVIPSGREGTNSCWPQKNTPIGPKLVDKKLLPQPFLQFLGPQGFKNDVNQNRQNLDPDTYTLPSLGHSTASFNAEPSKHQMPEKPEPQNESVNKDYDNDKFTWDLKPPGISPNIESEMLMRYDHDFPARPTLKQKKKVPNHKPKLNLRKNPPIRKKSKKTKCKSKKYVKPSPDRCWLSRWLWPSETNVNSS